MFGMEVIHRRLDQVEQHVDQCARREEIEEVKQELNEIKKPTLEILGTIKFARWAFVSLIAVIPIFTTFFEEIKDNFTKNTAAIELHQANEAEMLKLRKEILQLEKQLMK